MIFLYILGGILLLVAFLLSLRLKITLIYKKETENIGENGVTAAVGPVKIRLHPKKKKRLRLKDFSPKKYRKTVERDKAIKQLKSTQKNKKAKSNKDSSSADFKELFPDDFGEAVAFVADILKRFGCRVRCDVIRLILRVGMKDAATTAYTTFGVTFGVDALLTFIDKYATLKLRSPKEISVTPDFESKEFSGDVMLVFSIRVGSALFAGSGLIVAFFRNLMANDK